VPVDDVPIRLKMLCERDEVDDLVLDEGVRLGVGIVCGDLESMVGVRRVDGLEERPWLMIGLRDRLVLDRLGADGIDGRGAGWLRLGDDVRLRDEGIVRCGVERGIAGGADRLGGLERDDIDLGLLREGIVRWGVGREIERDGDWLGVLERDDIGLRLVREEDRIEDIERLGLELRLLREGVARCGVGRETDREGDRLAWLLLLRELRRDDPA